MTAKPLFRWTVGGVSGQGLRVLKESIVRTMSALGHDTFDWMVCYNNIDVADLLFVTSLSPKIVLYEQTWKDCPIPDSCSTIKLPDGTIRHDCDKCGGSLWKIAPPRLRPDSHEIIMDNDVVILRRIPAIEHFLRGTTKTILLEEKLRFFGRYEGLFYPWEAYNSGLIGLPPGYDFAADLYQTWDSRGRFGNLSYADEQGLITFVLKNTNYLLVLKDQLVELHHEGVRSTHDGLEGYDKYVYTGQEMGIHFVEANRMEHLPWLEYKAGSAYVGYNFHENCS